MPIERFYRLENNDASPVSLSSSCAELQPNNIHVHTIYMCTCSHELDMTLCHNIIVRDNSESFSGLNNYDTVMIAA